MLKLKLFATGLMVLILGTLLVTAASAQTGVTVTPSQLTIAGIRGETETRTLLLRTTGTITGLHVISLDLSRADGDVVLPADAVRVTLPADQASADTPLTLLVQVDLHGAPSGRFSGELLIDYHGGSLAVPMTVTIKDPWALPLLILVAGVGLGVGVSAYRTQGRPRDQVLVRVGQLRAQVRGDAELIGQAKPFHTRINAHLVDVEAALQAEKWQDAEQSVLRAEAVWLKWRRGRADWLEQLAYHTELSKHLEDEPNVPYIQTMRRDLAGTLRSAPTLDGPDKLRERLHALAQQINRYARLQARLDELGALRNRVSHNQAEPWRIKAQGFQRRLNDLNPGDDATYRTLQGEVETAITELTQLAAEQPELEVSFSTKGVRDLGTTVLRLLAPAPSVRPLTPEQQATGARTRLWWFTRVSYVIAVALLAGAGFGELYVANAVFGANTWGDYFALLAWGFGAEATRAALAQTMRNWGLPGLT
ncbi:MAG: hypothetical protein GY832_44370 [Chloroflexi bacterium]|nr:hypothetical protein [Chloroflexota bacterium]